ncbi:MAG: ATP-binding cassette domain-containing protein, partial [Gammaproteobacteria bacterium]|nr:ATP-binding cassette domain-containing protein [Gammaproteobacteria bacterium]
MPALATMALISFQAVSLSFGDQVIFRDADLSLDAGERVCVIGRNGAGKSTLFKLINGAIVPDDGEIVRRGGLGVAQLEQAPPRDLDIAVSEFVTGGLATHRQLIARYHALTARELDDAGLHELEALQREIEVHGGWDVEARVAAVITELGLPAERRMTQLSGGWQRRACLGRALVARPDLLLLDEPTNHLDLTAIEWLENHVRNFGGTVLFITHDRAFLRALATRIVDIDRGRLRSWPGDYDRYLDLREQAEAEEARNNALFDKKLAEEENWIRQGIKARRTRNEGRVRGFAGTVLFITHDRAFLRALATRIVDIDRGRLRSWPGDYERYLELKEQVLEEEQRANAQFDKRLEEEEAWIRQGIKARRTRNEGRVRALQRMRAEYVERIKPEGRARITLQDAEQSSRRVIQATNLRYAYG